MISNPAGLDGPGQQEKIAPHAVRRTQPSGAPPEWSITERPQPGEAMSAVFRRVADALAARGAEILGLMIFGSLASRVEIEQAMREALGEPSWPITFVEGASCDGAALAGVQAFATQRREIQRVRLGGRIVGSVYEEGGARFCLLGGLGPTATSLREPAQVQQAFGNLEAALELGGFTLGDVVRTWFYNDDILSWYDEFNRVRSALYGGVTFRTGSIPASTAVAGRNPAGAALTMAALAMRPLDDTVRAREIASPLQCPAPNYGSSFSRAMEITAGGSSRLLISGTASIYPGGQTAWVGNAKKQIDLTMEVVGAILQSRAMDFRHITRATAYFAHPLFRPYFEAWCTARGLRDLPVVAVHCDICRADLLFEIEVDASLSAGGGRQHLGAA